MGRTQQTPCRTTSSAYVGGIPTSDATSNVSKTTTRLQKQRLAIDEHFEHDTAHLGALLREGNHATRSSGQSAALQILGPKPEPGLVASTASLLAQQDPSLLFLAQRLAELRLRMTSRNQTHDDFCRAFEDEADRLLAMTRRKGSRRSWASPKGSSLVLRAATLDRIDEHASEGVARSETPLELELSYCQLGNYKPGTLHVTNGVVL